MREALAEASTAAGADTVIARAKSDFDATRADLTTAFDGGDLDRATTLATRLRYLDKLVEDARLRRRTLA